MLRASAFRVADAGGAAGTRPSPDHSGGPKFQVEEDGPMTSRLKLGALIGVLVLAMTLVGMFLSTGPKSAAHGPYQSALSSVGVATAEAARCANRACEFASPGYVCLEGSGTKCVFGGGCTTVSCNHH
jgi:hypothetical protein